MPLSTCLISVDGRGNSRSAEPLDLASPGPLGREQQKVSWTRLSELSKASASRQNAHMAGRQDLPESVVAEHERAANTGFQLACPGRGEGDRIAGCYRTGTSSD